MGERANHRVQNLPNSFEEQSTDSWFTKTLEVPPKSALVLQSGSLKLFVLYR